MSLNEMMPSSMVSPVGGRAPGGPSGGPDRGPGRAINQLVRLASRVANGSAGRRVPGEESAGRGKNALVGSGQSRLPRPPDLPDFADELTGPVATFPGRRR